MPKEYVESAYDHGNDFRVRVGWNRDAGYCQIATVDPGAEMVGAGGELNIGEDGYFVDLDRRGINDLIRLLRRARDQAFGRDE